MPGHHVHPDPTWIYNARLTSRCDAGVPFRQPQLIPNLKVPQAIACGTFTWKRGSYPADDQNL